MQKVKGLQGFTAVRDTVLGQLFKHSEIPHYVWINENGLVVAITDGEALTKTNIQKELDNQVLNIKMKEDVLRHFDPEQPLLAGANFMAIDNVEDLRILTKHVEGFPTQVTATINKEGVKSRIIALNCSIAQLLNLGYSKFNRTLVGTRNRTILEVKDTVRIKGPNYKLVGQQAWNEWYKTTTFCYEIIVSHRDPIKLWKEMQDDLTKYFPEYQTTIEKRKSKTLVLVRLTKEDLLKTGGGVAEHSDNKYNFHLRNAPWKTLPIRLQTYYLQLLPTTLIDETGITGNVDLDITANMSSVPELRKALQKYGIDIIEAERDVDYIVIRDRDHNPKI